MCKGLHFLRLKNISKTLIYALKTYADDFAENHVPANCMQLRSDGKQKVHIFS